jgi:outer membrane protein assembly factor BamB
VDFTHANAIDVMADGSYLISLRNLSQILKIDSTTGDILWRLGGEDGQFTFVNDSLNGFSCQHAARELPNGDIILFDDGDGHSPPQSRAVEYALDTTAMTATLVWSAEDNPPIFAAYMGNAERLPNGNTLIAYGEALHIQEVNASGDVLWDVVDPNQDFGFFRAFRVPTLSPLALTAN